MTPILDIAVAVITNAAGQILVGRRAATADHLPYRHEFPGGKVQPGESPAAACARECLEELGTTVIVHDLLLPPLTHVYPTRTVRLHFFRCSLAAGAPEPRPLETAEVHWLEPAVLPGLAWPDANLEAVALLARMAQRR